MKRSWASAVIGLAIAAQGCSAESGHPEGSGGASSAASSEAGGASSSSGGAGGGSGGQAVVPKVEAACATAHWCWENPLPQGYALDAVHGSGPADVWAVGELGTILHFDGTTFRAVASPTSGSITGVWAASPEEAWAVTTDPAAPVLHWDGTAWAQAPNAPNDSLAVWGTSANDVWIAASHGLWHRQSNHWEAIEYPHALTHDPDFTPPFAASIWADAPDDVWAFIGYDTPQSEDGSYEGEGALIRFDGSSWKKIDAPQDFEEWDNSGGLILPAAGMWGNSSAGGFWFDGKILEGSHWKNAPAAPAPGGSSIWGTSANDVWFGSTSSPGYLSHFDGSSTSVAETHVPGGVVWGASADDAWTIGSGGAIGHLSNHAWSLVGPGAANLSRNTMIRGSAEDDVWIAGCPAYSQHGSQLLHRDGSGWSADPFGEGKCFAAFDARAEHDVWAVAYDLPTGPSSPTPVAYVAHGDGSTWSRLPAGPWGNDVLNPVLSVWAAATDDAWVGLGDAALPTMPGPGPLVHWDGSTWTVPAGLQTGTFNYSVTGIWGTSGADFWVNAVCGTDEGGPIDYAGRIFHVTRADDGTYSMTADPSTASFATLWGRAADDIWGISAPPGGFATQTSGIYHYDGSAWSLSPGSDDFMAVSLVGASADDVWAINSAEAASHPDALLHWDGSVWTASDLPSMTLRSGGLSWQIFEASSGAMWLSGPNAAVLRYKD